MSDDTTTRDDATGRPTTPDVPSAAGHPPLPRRDQRRLRRPAEAVVRASPASLLLVGLLALGTAGLNLGIDFKGGTVWEVPAGEVAVGDARDALDELGLADATIQELDERRRPRDPGRGRADLARRERRRGHRPRRAHRLDDRRRHLDIGRPVVGRARSARRRCAPSSCSSSSITLYITFRFELKMAMATLAALLHDVLIVVGVYATLRVPGHAGDRDRHAHDPRLLDLRRHRRVRPGRREHQAGASTGGLTYCDMVNLSLNQVLMRSLNTSITALLPIGSLLVVGSFDLGADDARGVRPRPVHRPALGRLLVDLHRHAAPGAAEGARAPLRATSSGGWRPRSGGD